MSATDRIVMEGEWLKTNQAAQRLNVSPQRVDQFAKQGRLVFEVTPLGRLFSGSSVDALKAELTEARREPETREEFGEQPEAALMVSATGATAGANEVD